MAISTIAASANFQPSLPQVSQSSGHHHRHGGHHQGSISDVDAQSSSVASVGAATGTVGRTVNMTA